MDNATVSFGLNLSGRNELNVVASVKWAYEELHNSKLKPGWAIKELILTDGESRQVFNEDCGRGDFVKKIADGSLEFDYSHGTLKSITGETSTNLSFTAIISQSV